MHGIIGKTGPYCSLRGKGCRPLITYQISGTVFKSEDAGCGKYAFNWFSLLRVLHWPIQINEVPVVR